MAMVNTTHSLKRNIPMFWVIGIIMFALQLPWMHDRLSENRTYRDLTALTPFHGVRLFQSQITPDGILISGELIKRRCTFESLTAYAFFPNKPKRRIGMDTSFEPFKGSRPPSKRAESWGPWKLIWQGETPTSYRVFAKHVQCPSEPITQENLFIEGDWIDFHLPPDDKRVIQ